MKKDDIKTLIVVVVVCVFFVTLVLILNHKSNSEKLEPVSDYNTFFSTYNYISEYINNINLKNKDKIYNILYNDYIVNNNISIDNVLDYVEYIPDNISIKFKEVSSVEIKNNYLYYIKGELIKETISGSEVFDDNFEVILVYDYDSLTYSIYPLIDSNGYKIIDNIKKISITSNNYNVLKKTELVKKERICSLYLSDYINYLYKDIDTSYELLSNTMKKSYPTIDSFKEYINNNINKISTIADICNLETISDNRVYTVIDGNKNRYIFTEESILNYKVDIYIKNVE